VVQRDVHLVKRCRRGEEDALQELFNLYKERVFGILYGIVRDREESKDLLQEVFIKVFRSIGRFRQKSDLGTWIHRIAVNAALDHLRRQRPVQLSMEDVKDRDMARSAETLPQPPDPDLALRRAELGREISQAMRTLSADQRATILLREVEGLSYGEIAETMKCSKGTVMSRLHYARSRLRGALAEIRETDDAD
jgi:RNA polymerase sigma-70 factor (ECF subfamily)